MTNRSFELSILSTMNNGSSSRGGGGGGGGRGGRGGGPRGGFVGRGGRNSSNSGGEGGRRDVGIIGGDGFDGGPTASSTTTTNTGGGGRGLPMGGRLFGGPPPRGGGGRLFDPPGLGRGGGHFDNHGPPLSSTAASTGRGGYGSVGIGRYNDDDRGRQIMSSYSSLGRGGFGGRAGEGGGGGGGGGNNSSIGSGSYAELANSVMPSYADLGRDIVENNSNYRSGGAGGGRLGGIPPPSHHPTLDAPSSRGGGSMMIRGEYDNMTIHNDRFRNNMNMSMNNRGEYDNRIRGRSMDSREGDSSYGEFGGGNSVGGSETGLGSYAMMGVEMSVPHQHQEGGWMKRHRPNEISGGPAQMMMERRGPGGSGGDVMDGQFPSRGMMERDRIGGIAGPGPGGGRGLERGPPPLSSVSSGGPARFPTGDSVERFPPRGEWDRGDHNGAGGGAGGPPTDRVMPRGEVGGIGDFEHRQNHLPPPQDDQYGRGSRDRFEPTRHFSASEEDQFGRQRPPQQRSISSRGGFGGRGFSAPNIDRRGSGVGSAAPPGNQNSLHMSGRFVPGGGMDNCSNPDAEDQRGFYHQQQHQHQTGISGNMTQRFDGPPDANMHRSHPPQPASSQNAAPFKQSSTGQTHASDSSATNNAHHEHPRSQTPTPGNATGNADGANQLNQEAAALNESSANIVPESPTQPNREEDNVLIICPPSPPAAAPSAFALALSRMIEMNEDMEFAHARLMMLEHEHNKIQARLKTLENLQSEEGNAVL